MTWLLALCLLSQTRPRPAQLKPAQVRLFPGDRAGTSVSPTQTGYGSPWYRSAFGRECVRVYLPMDDAIEARLVAAGYREGYSFAGLRVKAACRCDWCRP